MKITAGRIVLYRLSENDVQCINRRRTSCSSIAERMKPETGPAWPAGAQAHIGNPPQVGDVLPMMACRIWDGEYGDQPGVNGQVFLDGNDVLWVTSVREGTEPGTWSWPERV